MTALPRTLKHLWLASALALVPFSATAETVRVSFQLKNIWNGARFDVFKNKRTPHVRAPLVLKMKKKCPNCQLVNFARRLLIFCAVKFPSE